MPHPESKPRHVWICLALSLLALPVCAETLAEKLALRYTPVPLHTEEPGRKQVGKLIYRGGIHVEPEKRHPRFGEISGLLVSPDGRRLLAVQDFGWWLTAELLHDKKGNLVGIRDAFIAPMLGADGSALTGKDADAEALTLPAGQAFGGDVLVSFEAHHRVDRYPFGAHGFAARPQPVSMPEALREAPLNGGLEAITSLQDGRLLGITELHANEEGNLMGWLVKGPQFDSISLGLDGAFSATDLATLPGGDIVVLERLFLPGFARSMRIRRIPRAALRPGAVLTGEVLAEMGRRYNIDNMEALAVRVTPAGRVLLYVASDDNRNPRQRTLLLQFELAP